MSKTPAFDDQQKFSFVAFTSMLRNSWRLLIMVWKEKPWLCALLALTVLVMALLPMLRAGAMAYLINHLVLKSGTSSFDSAVWLGLAGLVSATIALGIISQLQTFIDKLMYFFLSQRFYVLVMEQLGTLDIAHHEDPKFQDKLNRAQENGIGRLQNFAERQFFIAQNFVEALVAFAVLAYNQWWIALIIFAALIPEFLIEISYGNDIWSVHSMRAEDRRVMYGVRGMFSRIEDLAEMRIMQNMRYLVDRVMKLFDDFQDLQLKVEGGRVRMTVTSTILSQGAVGLAIVWFVHRVLNGTLQVGTLTFLIVAMSDLRQSLSGFFGNLGRQYQDNLFIEDVFAILDTRPAIIDKPDATKLSSDTTPQIEFRDVSFAYPDSKKMILEHISFTVAPGEKLAIIGLNGAGKTTLVKLFARFYDPTEGEILLNGSDLRDVTLSSWHKLLGALFQNYSKHRLRLEEAIAIGDTSIPLDPVRIDAALASSEARSFVSEWPHDTKQWLGSGFRDAVEPSIGQWQKLALARLFYRDPRIWILDEPTSSIDAEAEIKIFERLEKLPDDRTVILISHRFSTVRHADKIIVLAGGVIKESGTHEELIALGGEYARLFALQAVGYK